MKTIAHMHALTHMHTHTGMPTCNTVSQFCTSTWNWYSQPFQNPGTCPCWAPSQVQPHPELWLLLCDTRLNTAVTQNPHENCLQTTFSLVDISSNNLHPSIHHCQDAVFTITLVAVFEHQAQNSFIHIYMTKITAGNKSPGNTGINCQAQYFQCLVILDWRKKFTSAQRFHLKSLGSQKLIKSNNNLSTN